MRSTPPRWSRLLLSRVIIACATLGPVGRRLPAPGTWGSLAGLFYFAVFFQRASIGAILVASIVGGLIAVAICGAAEIRLGRRDPGEIILDEVVAMPLCFLGWRLLPGGWTMPVVLGVGFVLFR